MDTSSWDFTLANYGAVWAFMVQLGLLLLFLMLGLLMSISKQGALDGVTYVVSYGLKMLIPGHHDKQEKFIDYVQRKREKNKGKSFGFLYLTGAIYMGIAIVFLILFYNLYN